MRTHTLRNNFRGSTATAALLITLSAPAAFAQGVTTTDLAARTITSSATTYSAQNNQLLSATPLAETTDNNVNVIITTAIPSNDTVTTAIDQANNLISASATGNISTATAVLTFAPSTSGDTAAVGSLQSVEANVTAISTDDTHSVVVDNSNDGDVRTFTGSALQDNNDITASATGNNGTNLITAAAGLDITQAAAAPATVTINAGLATVTADLAVSSSQKIISPSVVSSEVFDAITEILIESLDGATVGISNSDQASSATGNTAANSLASLDTTASITGSTAVANQQSIGGSASITADTSGSVIEVNSGEDINGNEDGLVTNSTVSLTQNRQTAAATGSASTQTLTLNASSITGEVTPASIDDAGGLGGGAQISAQADAIIANDQSIEIGVTVTATVDENDIESNIFSQSDVTTSTLEVAGNTQSASATGVSTSNALSLTSGATMSATGAVASAQSMDGAVLALTEENQIDNYQSALDLVDSSMLTTGNTVSASATGANATNTLSTTTATNNLSYDVNTGDVQNAISAGTDQPSVTAGTALTNDQAQTGSVSATLDDNQVRSRIAGGATNDALNSTVTTDSNTLSASATGNQARNAINLAFNALQGNISGAGTGVVAGLANDQTLSGSVTALNVGDSGIPVMTEIDGDADGSTVSTSSNSVLATARGNVTTGNNVVVDATNITSGSQAAPSTVIATGAVSATGSFIAASTQESDADILASQVDAGVSNTIETQVGDDIQNGSTVVTDTNVLSASATANSAQNAVQLGTSGTAAIAASGVVANYQYTDSAGTVTATIGNLGSDAIAPFVSTNSAPAQTTAIGSSGTQFTNNGSTVTYTFVTALTSQEQAALAASGFQNITGNTADFIGGTLIDTTGRLNLSFSPGGDGLANTADDTLTFTGFLGSGSTGALNGAGVIARLTGTAAQILDSTVSVSGNTVVGEVNGNVATNATSATATSVAGLEATATSITVDAVTVAPANSDLATTNVQYSESALASNVAASFAIIADDGQIGAITDSTQTVSNNLQQSFATANRATNGVSLTATNTDADTALQSDQTSTATVATTSDMDVIANAGSSTSSLAMDGNRNQSVANGNVVANAITLDVTNATATGTVDASVVGTGPMAVTANNVLASLQSVTGNVTTAATTDVFNQDAARTGGNVISDGAVSLGTNATVAQSTGSSGSNTLTLGNAGTANMDRTGLLLNTQSVTATSVSAAVNQDVSVSLANAILAPLQDSSLSLDGNSTTALARSNVITNTLTVGGANIATGFGADSNASFIESTSTLTAAYVLGSLQLNTAGVTATTTQSTVDVNMTNAGADVIDSSTVSLSGNASTTSALANIAVNNVSVGATAANVDATAALGNTQDNSGAVAATGGSSVNLTVTASGTTAGDSGTGINGTSVLLSGNSSASNAVGNQAENSLTASGANISSGTTATNAEIDASTGGSLTASAANLLLSDQANSNTITSTNTANSVNIISSSAGDATVAGASGSTLSVTGNTTEARATANLALNSSINLGGASTSSADATGMIGNFQFNSAGGSVAALASTSTTVSLNGATAAGALNAGSATVQGNSTLALARGNVAANAVTAEGSNVSAGVSPSSITSGATPSTGILNASYGVLNEQVQAATVEATSTNARYAFNAASGGNALNNASASVGGNSVNASAFGNVATNSVTLVSLNGVSNTASAAVYNGQSNSGAITSLATGAQIGTYSFGGVAAAAVALMGNTISATAVGNFATSTVTRATR
jgi:hypothetical protein